MGGEGEAQRPRVLLVDDEPAALTTLSPLLSRDYQVVTAPNALAAMRELERVRCDAVVSDERMPGMPGTRFLGYVRRTHPRAARIILTAYSDSESLLRAINEGEVERFLLKPVQPVMLREALRELLERHRAEQADRDLSSELSRRNHELETRVRELEDARQRLDRNERLALAGQVAASIARDVDRVAAAIVEDHAGGASPAAAIPRVVRRIDDLCVEVAELEDRDPSTFALAPVRLDAWTRDYVRTLDRDPPLRSRRIDVETAGEVWCLLDSRRFGRLASSLIQNAVDATRAGDAITVRAGAAGALAYFEVVDTGVGLNPALRSRVFEAFFTTRPSHAGLGLHVSRIIAQGHGGAIGCESDPGRGTTVRVNLPRIER
jgi:signal transduction histidine kinase